MVIIPLCLITCDLQFWEEVFCCVYLLMSGDIPKFPGFPCSLAGIESACSAGDLGSIPGLGRSHGEGKGYPLQYSGLENSMDHSPWGCKESDMTERLSLPFTSSLCHRGSKSPNARWEGRSCITFTTYSQKLYSISSFVVTSPSVFEV